MSTLLSAAVFFCLCRISPAAAISFCGAVRDSGSVLEFTQLLLCLFAQTGRHLNLYGNVLVTVYLRILHRHNAFSFQADLRTGLCALTDLADDVSVQCFDGRFSAEYRCRIRNIHGRVHIGTLPLVARTAADCYFQKQIACLAASDPRLSFAAQTDALSGINARRNVDLQRLVFAVAICQCNPLVAAEGRLIECDRYVCMEIFSFALIAIARTKSIAEATSITKAASVSKATAIASVPTSAKATVTAAVSAKAGKSAAKSALRPAAGISIAAVAVICATV